MKVNYHLIAAGIITVAGSIAGGYAAHAVISNPMFTSVGALLSFMVIYETFEALWGDDWDKGVALQIP